MKFPEYFALTFAYVPRYRLFKLDLAVLGRVWL